MCTHRHTRTRTHTHTQTRSGHSAPQTADRPAGGQRRAELACGPPCEGVGLLSLLVCVRAHRGEASVVIEPLGPVGLVVDVVCHFLEVLEVGPEGRGGWRDGGAVNSWAQTEVVPTSSTPWPRVPGPVPRAYGNFPSPSCPGQEPAVLPDRPEAPYPNKPTPLGSTAYRITKSRSRANSQWLRFSTANKTKR